MNVIGQVVDKSWDFRPPLLILKLGLRPLILPERMQLANEEAASVDQSPKRFCKDEWQIGNVLKYEIADDQIDGLIFTWPRRGYVRDAEYHVARGEFRFSFIEHAF